MGKGSNHCRQFLEKRFSDDIDIEDAIHTAILTLKESYEGKGYLSFKSRFI